MERQIKLYFYRTCQLRLLRFYVITYFKSKKSLLVKEFNSNTPKVSNNELNANLHTRKSKATRYSFTDDEYNETSYYIQNGLRKVYPYYFTYRTFAKGRWCGKRILDVFASEFRVRSEPSVEFKRRIKEGLLTVNNEKVSIDYELRPNDLMSSTVHRHELPVKSDLITIIHKDEEKIVINKPASIPVHPCGRYRHNTILFILAKEYNLKNLLPIHRLDRLTSGILIFGRNADKAHSLAQEFYDHSVMKEYICRVEGDFPNGVIVCEEPIETVHRLIGISKVSPNGKHCKTVFEKISYNGRTSLIVCRPITGRSHQIRVHLQYLGFPVVKDPLYNHVVFGPVKGKGGRIGKGDKQLINDIVNMEKCQQMEDNFNGDWIHLKGCVKNSGTTTLANGSENNKTQYSSSIVESLDNYEHSMSHINSSKETMDTATNISFNPYKMSVDKNCSECKTIFKDPEPAELIMCLHAWKYKGSDWSYETELPVWTEDEWNE